MLFFLLIPLALLAITIAVAPVMVMSVAECRSEARRGARPDSTPRAVTDRSAYSRIQSEFAGLHPVGYPGGTGPLDQAAADGRSRAA